MNQHGDRTSDDRLDALTREVREGGYGMDALDVADAVLRRWCLADVIDEFHARQSNDGSGTSSSSD